MATPYRVPGCPPPTPLQDPWCLTKGQPCYWDFSPNQVLRGVEAEVPVVAPSFQHEFARSMAGADSTMWIVLYVQINAKQGPLRLLGTEAFCPLFLVGQTPAPMTFSEFQRVEQLLIKGEAARKQLETRLKGLTLIRLIQVRRPPKIWHTSSFCRGPRCQILNRASTTELETTAFTSSTTD